MKASGVGVRIPGAIGLLLAAQLACPPPAAAEPFVYTGRSGVTFTVTTNGLSAIAVGPRTVATGGWRLFDVGARCPTVAGGIAIPAPSAAEIEPLGPAAVRVRHTQGDLTARYTYRFDDEDVRVAVRVENNHPSNDLAMVGLTGLRFRFASRPEGLLNDAPLESLDSLGRWYRGGIVNNCHPSSSTPVGGCYRHDDFFGFGGTPLNTGLARTLFHGSPVTTVEGGFEQTLEYLQPQLVPHAGAATVELQLRVSATRDWKYLLEPYRTYFRATHGPTRYRSDNRPLLMQVFASSPHNVGPQNPLGGRPTLDTAESVDAYCDGALGELKQVNGQGVVIWALGGWEPRGAMFRTDFDVLPPAIERQLPRLRRRFEEANMKMGLCTRPSEFTVRGDWNVDWTFLVNPNDRQHLEAQVWVRFKRMIDLGFTLYYMDTFGAGFDDVLIMKYLRDKMGPDVQCYVEHDCDVMTVYAGIYDYVTWDAKRECWAIGSPGEIYRWLNPDIGSMIVASFSQEQVTTAGGPPFDYVYSQRCSPTLHLTQHYGSDLRAATEKYLDQDGRWRQ